MFHFQTDGEKWITWWEDKVKGWQGKVGAASEGNDNSNWIHASPCCHSCCGCCICSSNSSSFQQACPNGRISGHGNVAMDATCFCRHVTRSCPQASSCLKKTIWREYHIPRGLSCSFLLEGLESIFWLRTRCHFFKRRGGKGHEFSPLHFGRCKDEWERTLVSLVWGSNLNRRLCNSKFLGSIERNPQRALLIDSCILQLVVFYWRFCLFGFSGYLGLQCGNCIRNDLFMSQICEAPFL